MKKLFTALMLMMLSGLAIAQNATIKGVVKDKATGEAIIGANVVIEGKTVGASTDLDGNYEFKTVPGTYTIVATCISYKEFRKEVTVGNMATVEVNIEMEEDNEVLDAVEIVTEKITTTEAAVVQEVKEAEVVVSAVGAEQISKSQDRNAAQVARRIPGVTLIDNRFIMVRGLSQRYNSVLVNDVLSPSLEPDSRAFSFDIIPSAALDRLLVYKSGDAENPAEFAGAVIKVYTKNTVDENKTSVKLSMGYRTNTTGQNFRYYEGSSTDWIGTDDGKRAIPNGIPSRMPLINSIQDVNSAITYTKMFENNWEVKQKNAPVDIRFSAQTGNSFFIGGTKASNITAIRYTNTNQNVNVERRVVDSWNSDFLPNIDRIRTTNYSSTNRARLALIHNWAFRINSSHKIEFLNFYTQEGRSRTVWGEGIEPPTQQEVRDIELRYRSRKVYMGQLKGTHELVKDRTQVMWTGGLSLTNADEPDTRRNRLNRAIGSTEPFKVIKSTAPTRDFGGRFWSNMDENGLTGRVDLKQILKGDGFSDKTAMKVKAGYFFDRRDRKFNARWMSYTPINDASFNNALYDLPYNTIYAPENVYFNETTFENGFMLNEGTNLFDKYDANSTLNAGYVGATLPVSDFKFIVGARYEMFNLQLNSIDGSNQPINVSDTHNNILPFINASYNLNEKMLIRGSYGMTLDRPEFREKAPFLYYDFQLAIERVGNPELDQATIQNIDIRYEFYPSLGEALSFGLFYKIFDKPIEDYLIPTSSLVQLQPGNADGAVSYGAEIEVRKNFEFLTPSLKNFSALINASIIESRMSLGEFGPGGKLTDADKDRPMFGQSPYIINAGLYYNVDSLGLNLSMMYNIYGRRIFSVGLASANEPTYYEMPRHLLDITAKKKFLQEKLEISFGASNILDAPFIVKVDGNFDGKVDDPQRNLETIRFRRGAYIVLGAKYTF